VIQISMRNNFPEVARRLDHLPEKIANAAMAKALNKTIDQGKAEMARKISQEFRVSVGEAKARLSVSYSRWKGPLKLYVSLMATRPNGLHGNAKRGMNLIHFLVGGVSKRTQKGKLRQLNFQIKRSGGRKQIPGAFVATNKSTGGTAVFIRTGKGRMPIEAKTTIDIPQMFNTKRVNEVVRKVMLEKFRGNFDRELRSILKGYVKV